MTPLDSAQFQGSDAADGAVCSRDDGSHGRCPEVGKQTQARVV